MENATEALIITFAVIVFVIALSSSMIVMGQAKEAADHVFYYTDKTNFREYSDGKTKGVRIVGMETIIPTIYRQFKENFNVIILDKYNKKVAVYNSFEEGQLMNMTQEKRSSETYEKDGENYIKYKPRYGKVVWMGSNNEDGRRRVDLDLIGYIYPADYYKINGREYMPQLSYNDTAYSRDWVVSNIGLFEWLREKQFEEYFIEQRFSGKEIKSSENEYSLELVKGNSKMWIIYKEYAETED